jgi:hypothetical protein
MPFYNNTNIGGALDSNHIYYNISVQDNTSGTGPIVDGVPTELPTNDRELIYTFNEARAQPYLIKPEDYFVTVIRFTLDSVNLPVFIPVPVLNQPDVTKLIYTVTLQAPNGKVFQRPVFWVPDYRAEPAPPGPVTNSLISPPIPYYYCYSYVHFVDLINDSLSQLTLQYTNEIGIDPGLPYVYFDPETSLFQLGGPVDSYRTDSEGNPLSANNVNIFFNTPLLNLMSSLPASYVAGKVLDPNGDVVLQADYKMVLSTGSNVPYTNPQPYVTNVRLRQSYNDPTVIYDVFAVQEYETLSLWTPVTGIIFKTTLLSTAPENMATPVVYQNNNQNLNAGKQNAEVLNILADFYDTKVTGTTYKPYIYYEPSGEYKLTELYGKQPVNAIDIQVYWRDTFGNLVPFYLSAGATSTIKILFRKKIFNSKKI